MVEKYPSNYKGDIVFKEQIPLNEGIILPEKHDGSIDFGDNLTLVQYDPEDETGVKLPAHMTGNLVGQNITQIGGVFRPHRYYHNIPDLLGLLTGPEYVGGSVIMPSLKRIPRYSIGFGHVDGEVDLRSLEVLLGSRATPLARYVGGGLNLDGVRDIYDEPRISDHVEGDILLRNGVLDPLSIACLNAGSFPKIGNSSHVYCLADGEHVMWKQEDFKSFIRLAKSNAYVIGLNPSQERQPYDISTLSKLSELKDSLKGVSYN